ncbi:hypothetical protein V8C86DRAFT_2496861 [Haematococcus lacustris]
MFWTRARTTSDDGVEERLTAGGTSVTPAPTQPPPCLPPPPPISTPADLISLEDGPWLSPGQTPPRPPQPVSPRHSFDELVLSASRPTPSHTPEQPEPTPLVTQAPWGPGDPFLAPTCPASNPSSGTNPGPSPSPNTGPGTSPGPGPNPSPGPGPYLVSPPPSAEHTGRQRQTYASHSPASHALPSPPLHHPGLGRVRQPGQQAGQGTPPGPPSPAIHHQHSNSAPTSVEDDTDVFGLFSPTARPQGPGAKLAAVEAPEQQSLHREHSSPALDCPPVADFTDTDGATAAKRELLLYAVPLYKPEEDQGVVDSLVFLPVASFREAPDYKGVSGAIQERIDKLTAAAAQQWADLKEKEQGTFGNRVYKVGNRVVNDLTPEERLTRNIPKHVSKVIIYHPTSVPPDIIMERLTGMTSQHRLLSSAKAAVAGLMLPVAFGIDILIIPGPQVLTYWTSFLLYKNASSAMGTARLTKYISQSGSAKDVRVNYAGDARLDPFLEAALGSPEGVLDEDTIEILCSSLGEKELLEPLLELRARRLRESQVVHGSGSSKYSLLPSQPSH